MMSELPLAAGPTSRKINFRGSVVKSAIQREAGEPHSKGERCLSIPRWVRQHLGRKRSTSCLAAREAKSRRKAGTLFHSQDRGFPQGVPEEIQKATQGQTLITFSSPLQRLRGVSGHFDRLD